MGAAMTGMARHGGVLPVGGTFFVFSDYMRPSVRLAALSESARHLLVDPRLGRPGRGRPHPSARRAPGRRCAPCPACASSAPPTPTRPPTPGASRWTRDGPTALVLSRQSIPVLEGTAEAADGVARGGYVLVDPADGGPDVVLIGTGSRGVGVRGGGRLLAGAGAGAEPVRARVVSLPSWELFAAAVRAVPRRGPPPGVPRLAVEAAASFGWERYADDVVAIDHFGASAPGDRGARALRVHARQRARPGPGPCWPGPARGQRTDAEPTRRVGADRGRRSPARKGAP